MGRRKIIFIGTGILIVALMLLTSLLTDGSPAVTISVVGYTTNQWMDESYVHAVIGVTNRSGRSFTYLDYGEPTNHLPVYRILHQTPLGWKEADSGFLCGTGLEMRTLLPAEGFTFQAAVLTNEPCKIAFEYSSDSAANQIWQKLPYWLTRRLPWANHPRRAASEEIKLITSKDGA